MNTTIHTIALAIDEIGPWHHRYVKEALTSHRGEFFGDLRTLAVGGNTPLPIVEAIFDYSTERSNPALLPAQDEYQQIALLAKQNLANRIAVAIQ